MFIARLAVIRLSVLIRYLDDFVFYDNALRSARLNQVVGGSKNSMHIQGLAADILCPAFGPPLEVCRAIAGSGIGTDQIIHEFGQWCHVAFPRPGQIGRNEFLTIGASRLARNRDCEMYDSRIGPAK